MAWFRNLSASEVDRPKRDIKRAGRGSQLKNGAMTEGTLRIGGTARLEFENDTNREEIQLATPTNDGLMSAEYAAKLEGAPETVISLAVGTRVTVGGLTTFYNSGPRDIASYGANVTAGSTFQIRRTLDALIFSYSFLFDSAGDGPARFLGDLPIGWRPQGATGDHGAAVNSEKRHDIRLTENGGGFWNFVTDATGALSLARPTSGALIKGSMIIPAETALPDSLIGAPA